MSKDSRIQKEGLTIQTVIGAGDKEGTAPSAGIIQQNLAAFSAHQLMKNLRLWIRQGQRWSSSLRNSQASGLQTSKMVVPIGPEIARIFRDKQFDRME
jgi:hypothetical protein